PAGAPEYTVAGLPARPTVAKLQFELFSIAFGRFGEDGPLKPRMNSHPRFPTAAPIPPI
ncbi:unnamed protein product, partial [marine sediment metagenome]